MDKLKLNNSFKSSIDIIFFFYPLYYNNYYNSGFYFSNYSRGKYYLN